MTELYPIVGNFPPSKLSTKVEYLTAPHRTVRRSAHCTVPKYRPCLFTVLYCCWDTRS
jgi:hypothetical protein